MKMKRGKKQIENWEKVSAILRGERYRKIEPSAPWPRDTALRRRRKRRGHSGPFVPQGRQDDRGGPRTGLGKQIRRLSSGHGMPCPYEESRCREHGTSWKKLGRGENFVDEWRDGGGGGAASREPFVIAFSTASSEAALGSPVSKAKVSPAARRKATTKRTDDGHPVHSFRTLLADLATVTRNTVRLGKDLCATILATPTPFQQHVFDLLGVSPAADL